MFFISVTPIRLSSTDISLFLGIVLKYKRTFPPSLACVQTITKLWGVNQSLISSARRLPLPQIKGMHARIGKKALIFYWDTVKCEDENCETSAEPEWRKGIQETAMGSLIWRFSAVLTPPLLLIDSSLIPLICMLFPVSKQIACLRLSGHCRLVRDIVLQLSVWYGNNGQVITPENSKKRGVNFSKQARKKTQKGKKLKPRNIVDRANYLKLSFHVMY